MPVPEELFSRALRKSGSPEVLRLKSRMDSLNEAMLRLEEQTARGHELGDRAKQAAQESRIARLASPEREVNKVKARLDKSLKSGFVPKNTPQLLLRLAGLEPQAAEQYKLRIETIKSGLQEQSISALQEALGEETLVDAVKTQAQRTVSEQGKPLSAAQISAYSEISRMGSKAGRELQGMRSGVLGWRGGAGSTTKLLEDSIKQAAESLSTAPIKTAMSTAKRTPSAKGAGIAGIASLLLLPQIMRVFSGDKQEANPLLQLQMAQTLRDTQTKQLLADSLIEGRQANTANKELDTLIKMFKLQGLQNTGTGVI